MTDRELMELAAKAAGEKGCITERMYDGRMVYVLERTDGTFWLPRHDDGDALRLAVKLRLTISCDRYDGEEYIEATPPNTHQGWDCRVSQCAYKATRLAIVRAAAEIGRAMR